MANILRQYDTFGDYLEHIEYGKPKWSKESMVSLREGDPEHYGTSTFGEALDQIKSGYPKGVELMREALDTLTSFTTSIDSSSRARAYSMAGAYPCAPRAAAGDPMSMVTLGDQIRAARPVVRLAFSFSYGCILKQQKIENWGAALLANIDKLELEGQSVELTACHCAVASTRFETSIVLKRAGEALELDRMAFCLCSPAMLRRIHFRGYELEHIQKRFEGSYGVPDIRRPKYLAPQVLWLAGPQDVGGNTAAEIAPELEAQINEGLEPVAA